MPNSLKLLKKIRCRFLCKETGGPVSGIVASLHVVINDPNDNLVSIPIGTLCSDTSGYVSFDPQSLINCEIGTPHNLLITAQELPGGKIDLLNSLKHNNKSNIETFLQSFSFISSHESTTNSDYCEFNVVFPIYISKPDCCNKKAQKNKCSSTNLPAIQNPDVADYNASPYSFVAPVSVTLGDGTCETLVPSSLPLQEHRFYKVIVRREENEGDLGQIEGITEIQEVDLMVPLASHTPKIKFAEVIEFKQQWFSLGHSLGEIKYSLALAPGEATQVAIIDWSRQDNISRTDNVVSSEFMDHSLKRDRSIEETIDSALKESQGGSSFMAGTTGQATIPLQYVTLSFNHAIGYGVSNSWGNRNLEADSLQDLHDNIRQQSGYTRSLNSTVVIQATQAEQNVLQTRKVANHNHCHALTIQYYEVLRHFKIQTAFSGRKKAILIPFKPFAFTTDIALRFRNILEITLIDSTLLPCFDAAFRLQNPEIYNSQSSTTTPAPAPAPAPKMETKTFDVLTYLEGGNSSNIFVKQRDQIRITANGEAFTGGFTTFGPDGHTDIAGNEFAAPQKRKFSLIFKVGTQGGWNQGGSIVEFTAVSDGELIFAMNDIRGDYDNNRPLDHSPQKDRWSVTVRYPVHDSAGSSGSETGTSTSGNNTNNKEVYSKVKDELCLKKLLSHLNGNQGYYNGSVWVLQNPIERRLQMETALAANDFLLDAIDDVPLAVSGNYLAFAYDGPLVNWLSKRQDDPNKPIEDIVTLPTRGVFAEAMLGHCNACEERDPTRMWDWKEMTIEEPPSIAPVTQGPQGQTPTVTPAQLPANVIQIAQPPAAPDPTGLAAALKVLGTPDIFRDMSGLDEVSGLLKQLSEQSSEANIKALANQAQEKLKKAQEGSKTVSGGETSSGSTNNARAPATETDAAKQVDRLKAIEYGKNKGLLSEEAAANAAEEVVGGSPLVLEDTIKKIIINLDKYSTPEVRSFNPSGRDKSGKTTLRAVVENAPGGSTWHWTVADASKAQIVSPSAHITEVLSGHPGLVDLTFEAKDSSGASLGKKMTKLCVPQYVIITQETAAFDGQLTAYRLDDVKEALLRRTKEVVDFLLRNANLRTIWTLPPFNEKLPPQLDVGGFAAGKYNKLTIRGTNAADPSTAGITIAPGTNKPDEIIDIWPGAYTTPGHDVGVEVANIVTKLNALNLTDPLIKSFWLDIMGRLIGETIAHEIHHAILAFTIPTGHNSPSIPWDLMNRGAERSFLQRTGIEVLDTVSLPLSGSYRDGGIFAISGVLQTNQALVDGLFPVPPSFL